MAYVHLYQQHINNMNRLASNSFNNKHCETFGADKFITYITTLSYWYNGIQRWVYVNSQHIQFEWVVRREPDRGMSRSENKNHWVDWDKKDFLKKENGMIMFSGAIKCAISRTSSRSYKHGLQGWSTALSLLGISAVR
jgi:hypothetical protein